MDDLLDAVSLQIDCNGPVEKKSTSQIKQKDTGVI